MAKDTWTKLHQDLKLPAEAIAQIAAGTRHARAGQFGVRQLELYHNAEGQVSCSKAPTRKPSTATTPPSASPARGLGLGDVSQPGLFVRGGWVSCPRRWATRGTRWVW